MRVRRCHTTAIRRSHLQVRELHRRGLVVLDEDTREVAIRRWCRFHKFPGRWAGAAYSAFQKIESSVIKGVLVRHEGVNSIFPEKSKVSPPNSNVNGNVNDKAAARAVARTASDAAARQGKQDSGRPRRGDETVLHGVEVWTSADAAGLQVLVDLHGADLVEEVASGLTPAASHRAPYVSAVVTAFQMMEKAESAAAASAAHQAQMEAEATRQRVAQEQASVAHDYLESLDDSSRAALLDAFAAHLAESNKIVLGFFRRGGLKPPSVEVEFTRFIFSNYLTQREIAA